MLLTDPQDVTVQVNEWAQFNCTARCGYHVSWYMAGHSSAIKKNNTVPGLLIKRWRPSSCTESNKRTHFFEVLATEAFNKSTFYCAANEGSQHLSMCRCVGGRCYSRPALLTGSPIWIDAFLYSFEMFLSKSLASNRNSFACAYISLCCINAVMRPATVTSLSQTSAEITEATPSPSLASPTHTLQGTYMGIIRTADENLVFSVCSKSLTIQCDLLTAIIFCFDLCIETASLTIVTMTTTVMVTVTPTPTSCPNSGTSQFPACIIIF